MQKRSARTTTKKKGKNHVSDNKGSNLGKISCQERKEISTVSCSQRNHRSEYPVSSDERKEQAVFNRKEEGIKVE